ncbi:hypothetical protein HPP92_020600 [Vanilla planifolia]|uniref:Uncharacterized protein n=1 Tax=Vanilla planifolia TaxID=51239 RepID=A0A835PYD4_VANPL|nr:hypothetical protein HPP92_020600 [Vanilla planifolia]
MAEGEEREVARRHTEEAAQEIFWCSMGGEPGSRLTLILLMMDPRVKFRATRVKALSSWVG